MFSRESMNKWMERSWEHLTSWSISAMENRSCFFNREYVMCCFYDSRHVVLAKHQVRLSSPPKTWHCVFNCSPQSFIESKCLLTPCKLTRAYLWDLQHCCWKCLTQCGQTCIYGAACHTAEVEKIANSRSEQLKSLTGNWSLIIRAEV